MHSKVRDQQLKKKTLVYIDCCIKNLWQPQTTIDTVTKRNTSTTIKISTNHSRREQKRKGREMNYDHKS